VLSKFKKYDFTPSWVLLVVRFKNQITTDLSKIKEHGTNVVSLDYPTDYAFDELPPMVISEDCVSLNVSSSKLSHTHGLQAVLTPGKNYLREIKPGDWVCAWINDNKAATDFIAKQISGTTIQKANHEGSGLKFVGKINGIRKSVSLDGQGNKQTRYTLTAHSFSEFNNEIYFSPEMETKPGDKQETTKWAERLNINIGEILESSDSSTGVSSEKIIPAILDVTLGQGIPVSFGPRPLGPNEDVPCRIPATIAKVMGITTDGAPVYRDILEVLIGSQKTIPYQQGSTLTSDKGETLNSNEITISVPFNGLNQLEITNKFVSSKTKHVGGDRPGEHYCAQLGGKFPLVFPTLDGKPIWTLIGMYLNSIVNELYTTLRRSNDPKNDSIFPCLVARQKPFNTLAGLNVFDSMGDPGMVDFHISSMLDIATWKITDSSILAYDVGSSDSTKVNYIRTGGVLQNEKTSASPGIVFNQNGPIWDKLDQTRNGLHSVMSTVNCTPAEGLNGPLVWNKLLMDSLSGLCLTYSGTLTSIGISQPIAIGDNLELNDIIYHIESVSHNCSRAPNGQTSFTTNMSLTHGMVREDLVEKSLENLPNLQIDPETRLVLLQRTNQYPVSTFIDIKELDDGTISNIPPRN
jgi:hypothetical protein